MELCSDPSGSPSKVSNGTWSRQLNLRYFDQLLWANVSGIAACENPATSLQLAPPLVMCRTTHVMVKLPLGSRLQRVKALGKGGVAGKVVTTATTEALYMQIPKVANMVRTVSHDLCLYKEVW